MQTTASTLVLKEASFSEQVTKPEKQLTPGGFYQQIVSRLNDGVLDHDLLEDTGGKLVALADYAYALRQMDFVEETSHMLWKPSPALLLYIDADRAIPRIKKFGLLTTTEILCVIARLKNTGDHYRGALTDFEDMFPLACAVGPQNQCLRGSYLNSLAIGMPEAERVEEARRASEITLASPYASAYAEWHETRKDMARNQYRTPRSFVAINQSSIQKENVLHLPAPGPKPGLAMPAAGRAKLLNYTDWKKKMGKEPNGNENDDKPPHEMTGKEMIYRIINLFTHPGTSEEKRLEMIRAVEKIASRPDYISNKDADND